MKQIHFENLDGLRFIAFFCIFLTHGIFSSSTVVLESEIYKTIKLVLTPTSLGVPFFFCLSGFLITFLLLIERENFGQIDIKKFYMRRILRIWPLYYTVVFFGFFVVPYIRQFFISEPYIETASFWMYFFFLSNFDQIQNGLPYGAGLGVTWSLSVEEQFYLIWPLLLSMINSRYFIHLTVSLFLIGHYLLTFTDLTYTHTLGSMVDLSIGAFLAIICYKKNRLFYFIKNLSKKTIIVIYLIGILQIYLWLLGGIGNRIFTSLFMAFVIFEQCYSSESLLKMSQFKRVSYLGTLTYGFYLLHTISNFIVHNVLKLVRNDISNPFLTDLIIHPFFALILTLIMGYTSYKFIESPFLNLKKKYSKLEPKGSNC